MSIKGNNKLRNGLRFVHQQNRIRGYHFDKLTCVYDYRDESVDLLKKLEGIDLDTPLDLTFSSRLIESLFIKMPIKPIIVFGVMDRYIVVDGRKRLAALIKYFNNEYALTDLEALTSLEGLFFKDLDQQGHKIISLCNINLIIAFLKQERMYLTLPKIREITDYLRSVYQLCT